MATVTDNRTLSRYELELPGGTGFIDYRRSTAAVPVVTMLHAEVPAALQGRGYGAALTRGALDLVRAQGERVIPHCSYVAAFIHAYPEFQSLLATHSD